MTSDAIFKLCNTYMESFLSYLPGKTFPWSTDLLLTNFNITNYLACEDINECDVDPTVCGENIACCNLYGTNLLD